MPAKLRNPKTIRAEIDELRITSWVNDQVRATLIVNFIRGKTNVLGGLDTVTSGSHTFIGNELLSLIKRVNTLLDAQVKADVYAAMKQAMYEAVSSRENLSTDVV